MVGIRTIGICITLLFIRNYGYCDDIYQLMHHVCDNRTAGRHHTTKHHKQTMSDVINEYNENINISDNRSLIRDDEISDKNEKCIKKTAGRSIKTTENSCRDDESIIITHDVLPVKRVAPSLKFPHDEQDVRDETRDDLLNCVDTQWSLPTVPNNDEKIHTRTLYNNPLSQKIHEIIIPHIQFSNAPLSNVIDTLSNYAEQYQTSDSGTSQCINFILLDAGADKAAHDISLNLKNLSLYRVIELISQSANLQFDITHDTVIFYHKSRVEDIVETEFFPISRATLIRLTGVQTINHHDMSYNDNHNTIIDDERAIKEFFHRAGINFSDSTTNSLAFDGAQIIVTTTHKNLEKIGRILQKYTEVQQVEIETKFLEVQQGVLEELGLRWNISNRDGSKAFFSTGKTSDEVAYDNLRTLSQAFASNNFSSGDGKIVSAGAEQITVTNNSPNIPGQLNLGIDSIPLSNFTGVLNNIQCNVLIQALEQHTGTDLMSAPKLTVLSGKTADITVAMELRYPQHYGDTHSEVGAGSSFGTSSSSAGVTITSGTPQNFTMRNIGVEMSVTPTVEVDKTISLQLEPKVTEFEGFVEYGGVNVAVSSGTTVTVPSGFYQPIFSTREIHTEVNICDGATVVMGGLTREEVKEIHDKVPILGSLPLLGKLFKSKSETTQKRNLLIFVTAHTISPTGEPLVQKSAQNSNNSRDK